MLDILHAKDTNLFALSSWILIIYLNLIYLNIQRRIDWKFNFSTQYLNTQGSQVGKNMMGDLEFQTPLLSITSCVNQLSCHWDKLPVAGSRKNERSNSLRVQRVHSMVGWLQGRRIMMEGFCRTKFLSLWQLRILGIFVNSWKKDLIWGTIRLYFIHF